MLRPSCRAQRKAERIAPQRLIHHSVTPHVIQAQCRHYKTPCLLIEFDESNNFGLLKESEIGADVRIDSPISKMILLVYAFPRMRILWSRNAFTTLEIFREAKLGRDEVDVEAAMRYGREDEERNGGGELGEEVVVKNEAAIDMLMRLPGVTKENAGGLMEEGKSINGLCALKKEVLKRIMGAINSQRLYTFLRQKPDICSNT